MLGRGAVAAGMALLVWGASGLPGTAAAQARFATPARVVVFGDVHGAYEGLVELLRAAGIIDAERNWSGGQSHLVGLGDLIDRGGNSRAVLDLLMRLEREAAAAGGRLHVVLGNHELMNLMGDWRYLVSADYESFAAEESDSERAAAYAEFAATAGGDSPTTRATFDAGYPRGFFARQAAFAPTGRYGAWLRARPAAVVVNDTAYVHGGLPPVVAQDGLEINERLRADLDRYFELRDRLVAGGLLSAIDRRRDMAVARAAPASRDAALSAARAAFLALGDSVELGTDGPLWYRGSVYCKPILEQPTLDAALERLGAARVVVGHTPTPDRRAHALYDGKLVTLDTGMLAEHYQGRPAALLVDGARIDVQYVAPNERAALDGGYVVGFGRPARQLRAALEHGDVVAVEGSASARVRRVTLSYEGEMFEAAFYPRRNDRAADFELAAASLDDALGTDLIAPTAARTIDNQAGALQLRYPGAISEAERAERALPFSGWCPIEPQLKLMYAFDLLLGNRSRTSANALFINELTDLTLVDHGRAFAPDGELPPRVDLGALGLTPALRASLQALDAAELTESLGSWLDTRRITALLSRRDRLLMSSQP